MLQMIVATVLGGILGFIAAVFLIARYRVGRKRTKKPKKREFKKLLVVLVLASYFVGLAVGGYVTFKYDYSQLVPLLTFIGTLTTGAILSYCYVIRTENAIKLKQQYPKETEGYNVDINNTSV